MVEFGGKKSKIQICIIWNLKFFLGFLVFLCFKFLINIIIYNNYFILMI